MTLLHPDATTSVHTTSHAVDVEAPAAQVYAVVADAVAWPHTFAPTVHVERTGFADGAEELAIWASANGQVKAWTSHRELDPVRRRVSFRQLVSAPPVASMGGEWIVEEIDEHRSRLVLLHDFTAVDDDPAGVEWITAAVEGNSTTELANIKAVAEVHLRRSALVFSFADSVVIEGSLADAYHFLYRADLWSERLPHVGSITVDEAVPGVQAMVMETVTKDGSRHTTESVRVCFDQDRIVYKQTRTPPLMTAHTGVWSFEPGPASVTVTSHHTIAVNEAAITRILGADATLESTKAYLRTAIGGNSAATLALTKAFVEGGRRG